MGTLFRSCAKVHELIELSLTSEVVSGVGSGPWLRDGCIKWGLHAPG